MKKKVIFSIIVMVIIAVIGYKIYSDALGIIKHPFITEDTTIELKVKSGDTLTGVINSLYEDKKIGNSYLIKWYIKKQQLSTNIKPGTYNFSKDISLEKLIKGLGESKYNENSIKVTIPEGYDVEHIATLLQDNGIIEKEKFIQSVKEYTPPSYIKTDIKRKYALEGFLFPDTYELIKGMKGKDIIDIMLKNFEAVLKNVQDKSNKEMTVEEIDKIIILASMVERETEAVDERVVVSSVLHNRLNIKMKLQIDATVEYALGVHKTIYTYKDLEFQSPYNTYLVSGLPIGPICNPGKASILAAMEPASTKYIYYVSKFDGSKTHFFSENYDKFLSDKKVSQTNLAKMNK
jgi:UPF0755 protein